MQKRAWMDGHTHGFRDGCMTEWINDWMDEWMNARLDEWIDTRMEGWIRGLLVCVLQSTYVACHNACVH